MQAKNVGLAQDVLYGMTLEKAAEKYHLSRGRCWQVTRAFCLERFLRHQLVDDNGNMRDLKGLREKWKKMLDY